MQRGVRVRVYARWGKGINSRKHRWDKEEGEVLGVHAKPATPTH